MSQTTKVNQSVAQQDKRSYSAILTCLFLGVSLLSACVQQDDYRSAMANEDSDEVWRGVTCPITQLPTDSMSAGDEQFEVCEPEVWGAAKNVVGLKHVYISSQPDEETFEIAREKGVALVINLRDPEESEWDEENAAEQAELGYYNVPISGQSQSFDPEAIKQISALVQQHKDQKILLHCSSGNRASAWLAIHLAQEHDIDTDKAISLAKQTGLTSPAIEARVKHYLQEHAQH
jgi:uncharacterized protein (TIGR01244 family)